MVPSSFRFITYTYFVSTILVTSGMSDLLTLVDTQYLSSWAHYFSRAWAHSAASAAASCESVRLLDGQDLIPRLIPEIFFPGWIFPFSRGFRLIMPHPSFSFFSFPGSSESGIRVSVCLEGIISVRIVSRAAWGVGFPACSFGFLDIWGISSSELESSGV